MEIMQLLFVCTGNTCRSPMAAAYAADFCRRAGRGDVTVCSAGISAFAGCPASAQARQVMAEQGMALDAFRSTRLTAPLLDASDLVITMTRGHRDAILRAAPDAAGKVTTLLPDGDVADPFGGGVDDYRFTFEQMRPALETLLKRIFIPSNDEPIQYPR